MVLGVKMQEMVETAAKAETHGNKFMASRYQ